MLAAEWLSLHKLVSYFWRLSKQWDRNLSIYRISIDLDMSLTVPRLFINWLPILTNLNALLCVVKESNHITNSIPRNNFFRPNWKFRGSTSQLFIPICQRHIKLRWSRECIWTEGTWCSYQQSRLTYNVHKSLFLNTIARCEHIFVQLIFLSFPSNFFSNPSLASHLLQLADNSNQPWEIDSCEFWKSSVSVKIK